MGITQRIIAITAILVISSALFLCKDAVSKELLIVGDSQHPPYSFLDNDNKQSGIYVETVKAVLESQEQFDYRIELYPWSRALHMIKTGAADAIFPPHYFPEKRKYISQYSLPILEEKVKVYRRSQFLENVNLNKLSNKHWELNLSEAHFAISRGVRMGGNTFWELVDKGEISITETMGVSQALKMLLINRADCHINDSYTVKWYLNKLNLLGQFKNTKNVVKVVDVSTSAGYLGISTHMNPLVSAEFLRVFNKGLENLKMENKLSLPLN